MDGHGSAKCCGDRRNQPGQADALPIQREHHAVQSAGTWAAVRPGVLFAPAFFLPGLRWSALVQRSAVSLQSAGLAAADAPEHLPIGAASGCPPGALSSQLPAGAAPAVSADAPASARRV